MVTVERFDISQVPDHGRPRVVELRGKAGRLSLHCSREDGSLWLFAVGPSGGDRGHVVFPVRQAPALLAWLDGEEGRRVAPSTAGALWLDDRERWPDYRKWPEGAVRVLVVRKSVMQTAKWELPLDEAGHGELLTALREWAGAVVRASREDPDA